MEKVSFQTWLVAKRAFGRKSAQDAASRCKRVEKTLGMPLDRVVSSQEAFNTALQRIWRAHAGRHDLLYAMRLYAAFGNPRIDTRKYAFYGGSKRKETAK
jgi:hypothetical protein